MHRVKQELAEIAVGTDVKFRDCRMFILVKSVDLVAGTISGTMNDPSDESWERKSVDITINYEQYEFTELNSPDFDGTDEETWGECEKHYGISHLGSADPDPIRQLAFALLRGDKDALMAVRNVLWMSEERKLIAAVEAEVS